MIPNKICLCEFNVRFTIAVTVCLKQDDDDDDDYDEDDYEGVDSDMKDLLDKLPPEAKRKVLSGKKIQHDEDDEDDEDENEEGWGRKKSAYWSADTADLEIGQDVQDAEDEELAAKDLQKQTLKKLKENDFYESFNASDSEEGSVEATKKKASSKHAKKSDKLTGELQVLALGTQVIVFIMIKKYTVFIMIKLYLTLVVCIILQKNERIF